MGAGPVNEEHEDAALMMTLQERFARDLRGWLQPRYTPDLHRSGVLEADLRVRLFGPQEDPGLVATARRLVEIVERARAALDQLTRHPAFLALDDAEPMRLSGAGWLDVVLARQARVLDALRTQTTFPLVVPTDNEPTVAPELTSLLRLLGSNKGHRTTEKIERSLHAVLTPIDRRRLFERLRAYGLPVLYYADPGAGKTHALARAVEESLANGVPTLLLRARELDPRQDWSKLLGDALERPGAPLHALLTAMDRAAASRQGRPRRLLIALDGLDESRHRAQWAERLRELATLTTRWPEVLFAVSTRTHLAETLDDIGAVARVPLGKSNAPLREVFRAHCEASHIHTPPWLRWALVDPLSIRLFADLFRGQDLKDRPPFDLSLTGLMARKLEQVEATARVTDADGWDERWRPVRALLRILARLSLGRDDPIPILEVTKACEDDTDLLRISSQQHGHILAHCRDEGLLLQTIVVPQDRYADDIECWEPVYQPLTDFLIAREIVREIEVSGGQPRIPSSIAYRYDIYILVAEMLTAGGHRIFEEHLWAEDLDEVEREDLQLRGLIAASSEHARTFAPFVRDIFLRDRSGCLRVVELLVVPTLRREHPFDARFVQEVLARMSVADRDLRWSGPPGLDSDNDEIWAGHAVFPRSSSRTRNRGT
ncbi:hypothetical protein [Nannocystis sp.]|uniref:hypothetical protein n=1 Tax=Nannocystis sp. TaxID=1962667 RepID=UPI00260029D1|nr:hypothetical protein [Nannocystis sp.]MBK7828411.1 hypothetical protein [Nannocystis sp.]